MANYRTWGKQFRAYFDTGCLDTLPCTQQEAYLNNCINEVLRARVNREVSATTPIYSNVPGFMTSSRIMDSVFLETNPIHLRRKQFFDARQREGQTVFEFREELLSLIEETDGDNIGVNDLICMMLQIGVSVPVLQRELGSIKNPTLLAFNDKIEGFEQARKKGEDRDGKYTRKPRREKKYPSLIPMSQGHSSYLVPQTKLGLSLIHI